MADLDLEAEAIAEGDMDLMFLQTSSVAIAPATIGKDKQAVGIWLMTRSGL